MGGVEGGAVPLRWCQDVGIPTSVVIERLPCLSTGQGRRGGEHSDDWADTPPRATGCVETRCGARDGQPWESVVLLFCPPLGARCRSARSRAKPSATA